MANQYDGYFIHPDDIPLEKPWQEYCQQIDSARAALKRVQKEIENFQPFCSSPYPKEDFDGRIPEEFISEAEWEQAQIEVAKEEYETLLKESRELQEFLKKPPSIKKTRYLYFLSEKQYCRHFNLPYPWSMSPPRIP